ncbi:MAG: helix-turn-helix domain-containing protein [Synechococcus sp.]|nr:helix-turn-helix domain-containing protein [Synechococcus sp.]
MRTRELAEFLGIHRNTLGRMVRDGVLKDGCHRCKINPLSPRGEHIWNRDAVLAALRRL